MHVAGLVYLAAIVALGVQAVPAPESVKNNRADADEAWGFHTDRVKRDDADEAWDFHTDRVKRDDADEAWGFHTDRVKRDNAA
ncbi:hypothetical protein CMQ_6561 [Grosmannia clavigera kw1407]|uniref:Uncharacterized protein n=1 Tax=Grosmannia clavigera (strain kw1407 / UAMH 11150) TaxID=655863 RepID=F0X7T6_GROCL|nr:uncharacterized protein CMQ_6561 [Grosmannia clavigera kw1407]EFX06240.1 hypothetical protein CMQ_6561 [Grosmannia clavigera kw1407]